MQDDKNIESVFNTHLIDFDYNSKYTYYEVEMKYIKDVLIDLSILLSYDLEPCNEIINIKHSQLNGISYPIFKECLYDYLDKMEIKLNTMFFVEQSSYSIEEIAQRKISNNNGLQAENDAIKDTVSLTNDVSLLITHRSLFILKKKFESFKQEIKQVYKKYSEESIDDHLIDMNNFIKLTEEVMTKAKFMLVKANDFKELTQKEMQYVNSVVIDMDLLDQLNVFITHERRKYNVIYRDKRMKVNFALENYKDYMPIGDDDLTKVCIEEVEIDEDNDEDKASVIDANKNNNLIEQLQEKGEENNQKNLVNQSIDQLNQAKEKNTISLLSKDPKTPISVQIKQQSDNFSINHAPENNSDQPKSNLKQQTKRKIKRTYQKNYLFIETLPLILADFLSTSPDYAICDLNDDIRVSLRTLFDNEILQRLGEYTSVEINRYKTEKLKDLLFTQSNIEKNIQFYKNLLYTAQAAKGNTAFISVALQKLNENKKWLMDKIKRIQDDNDTFNEYENAINEQEQKNKEMMILVARKTKANPNVNALSSIEQSPHQLIHRQSITQNDQSSIMNDYSISRISNPIDNSNSNNNNDNSTNNPKAINFYQKIIPKNCLTKDEIRLNSLKEIFYFYSRQHVSLGKQSTFDSMKSKMDHLDLSEFSKFCVEFKILITKDKLVELFKKNSSNTKQMSFEEFYITLQKISLAINEEKKRILKKRIIHLRNIIETNKSQHQQQESENEAILINTNQEEGDNEPKLPSFNINNITLLKENQINEEITTCRSDLDKLNKKTYQQLLDELFLYMDLDQEILYRDKMKGFNLPYLNKAKNIFEALPPIRNKISKTVDKRTAKEIHQMIEDRKRELQEQKALEIKLKGMELAYQKKFILGNINRNVHQASSASGLSPLGNANKKGVILTVKQQKEIRELQRKKKEKEHKEFNKKIKRVYLKVQNEQKIKEEKKPGDSLESETDKAEDESNTDRTKTMEERQKEELERLLKMKHESKVGNKFTWEAIEKLKPIHLVMQSEMNKYIK